MKDDIDFNTNVNSTDEEQKTQYSQCRTEYFRDLISQNSSVTFGIVKDYVTKNDLENLKRSDESPFNKMFAIALIRRKKVLEELRYLVKRIATKYINISIIDNKFDWQNFITTVQKEMANEVIIFNDPDTREFFANIDKNFLYKEAASSNKLHIISNEAVRLFDDNNFVDKIKDFFDGNFYTLLDEYIRPNNFAIAPFLGDENDPFGNNKISAIIFFLVVLYNCLLKLENPDYKNISFLINEEVVIGNEIIRAYKMRSYKIKYIDFSYLVSRVGIPKIKNSDNTHIKLKDSIFYIETNENTDNNDWLAIPHNGYGFGSQQNNKYLEEIVGDYRKNIMYPQDCSSIMSLIYDFDYDRFSTHDYRIFEMLVLDLFTLGKASDNNEDIYNFLIEINSNIKNVIKHLIVSINMRQTNEVKKSLKKFPNFSEMMKNFMKNKGIEDNSDKRYIDIIQEIIHADILAHILEKAKYMVYCNKKNIADICYCCDNGRNIVFCLNHYHKNTSKINFTLDDIKSGHIGLGYKALKYNDTNPSIIYISLSREMENVTNTINAQDKNDISGNFKFGLEGIGLDAYPLAEKTVQERRCSLTKAWIIVNS